VPFWFLNRFNLTRAAGTVDPEELLQRRRYQHSDTGYGSQFDTGLEAALRTTDHTCVHRRPRSSALEDFPDTSAAWNPNRTKRRSPFQDAERDRRSGDVRRGRRRLSRLDCSVIGRSATTTTINQIDQKNQVASY